MTLVSQPANQQDISASKQHIILVEDDPGNAEVLDLLLQAETHYQVTCFRTGYETIANVDRIKTLHPILFILDYKLPTMTALDLYEQLHAAEGLKQVPAVVLSGGRISDTEKTRMLQQGLLFIPKPYDIDDFLSTIEHVIDEGSASTKL